MSPSSGQGLFLPAAGYRSNADGNAYSRGSYGLYWSSSVYSSGGWILGFSSSGWLEGYYNRARGFSVRCVQE